MSSLDLQPNSEPDPPTPAEQSPEACTCDNCGALLYGAYCAACGQRDEPLRKPIVQFLTEAFIEFVGVDGRLWRSLGLLLWRPGRLTKAYLEGKRMPYIRPLRLYLIASLVFFFLLSVIDPVGQVSSIEGEVLADTTARVEDYRETINATRAENATRLAIQATLVDSLERQFAADSLTFAGVAEVPEEDREALKDARDERNDERRDLQQLRRQIDRENRRFLWVERQLATAPPDSLIRPADLERAAELILGELPGDQLNLDFPDWWPRSEAVRQLGAARTGRELRSGFTAFFRDALQRLPTVIFLLLPVFAMLLKILYLRRGWYYSEHLVFGLHTHSFTFIMYTIMLLLVWVSGGAGWASIIGGLLTLLIPVYFYVAQKHVYGQSWLKTALKVTLLGLMYLCALSMGILFALVLATAI